MHNMIQLLCKYLRDPVTGIRVLHRSVGRHDVKICVSLMDLGNCLSGFIYGPRPLNSTGRHEPFLKSTGDISFKDVRRGEKNIATCNIAIS